MLLSSTLDEYEMLLPVDNKVRDKWCRVSWFLDLPNQHLGVCSVSRSKVLVFRGLAFAVEPGAPHGVRIVV